MVLTKPQNSTPAAPLYSCNAINPTTTTIADRIAYYHACCFSPALSTWCKAIDEGRFTTWPELTSMLVRCHPPRSAAMIKGHLDQSRANQRSTKIVSPPSIIPSPTEATVPEDESPSEVCPPETTPPALRTHAIYADCHSVSGQIYSDLPGCFLAP